MTLASRIVHVKELFYCSNPGPKAERKIAQYYALPLFRRVVAAGLPAALMSEPANSELCLPRYRTRRATKGRTPGYPFNWMMDLL